MDDSPPSLEDSKALQVSGKIMVLSVVVMFIVVTVVLIIHIYARWHWSRSNSEDPSIVSWRGRRFVFMTTGSDTSSSTTSRAHRRGLDSKVLESLPVIVYNPKDFKDGLECAVCLSEVEEGEKARLLPNCNHGFHNDCIDMWFQSHSTCPLCRNHVTVATGGRSDDSDSIRIQIDEDLNRDEAPSPPPPPSSLGDDDRSRSHVTAGISAESSAFPANILFWGNQTQVSSLGLSYEERQEQTTAASSSVSSHRNEYVVRGGSDGRKGRGSLVIDIPKRVLPTDNRSSSSPMGMITSTHHDEKEMKSPATPSSTRLENLKRLLSRGKRAVPSACSSTSSSSESATGGVHHQIEQV